MKKMAEKFQPQMNPAMIGDIDCVLDQQLDIKVSVLFYSTLWVLILPTIYLNILVLQMLKREELSISLELKIFAITNIIASVYELVHHGILRFAFPASVKIGAWYCHIGSVLMAIEFFRNAIHSLSLSIYRYVFIVHMDKIKTDKQKQQLTWLIFAVKWTIIMTFTAKIVIFNVDEFSLFWTTFWTTVCNGKVLTQRPNRESANVTQFLKSLSERSFYRLTQEKSLITIFGNIEGNSAYPLQAFCIVVDILATAICTNILEGIFYHKTAKYMKA